MTRWECIDCGWVWPVGIPGDDTECDNCGGELVPADDDGSYDGGDDW